MAARLSAYNLRSVISELLPGYYKNYEIEQACTAFGMPEVENAWTYNSKRVYVSNRLGGVLLPEMIEISRRILAEHHDPELSQMLYGQGLHGVNGELHNLISPQWEPSRASSCATRSTTSSTSSRAPIASWSTTAGCRTKV